MSDERASLEQNVVSTVITSGLGEDLSERISKLLEKHRGFFQHQIVCMASEPAEGEWYVNYIPDSDRIASNLLADAGETLDLSGSRGVEVKFTAALRGIVLIQSTGGDTGVTYTFLLTSTRGPLIND